MGHGFVSGQRRKAAGVAYPNPYASPDQVKNNKDAYKFTCAQRAHGNFLENMPQTMASMMFAGLGYPVATAVLGLGWVMFRVVYAYGYVNSDKPNGSGRLYGSGFWLMQGGIWALCCAMAIKMI